MIPGLDLQLSWILYACAALLGILGILYLFAPIAIYCALRFRMPFDLVPLQLEEQPLPGEVAQHFENADRALIDLGFESVGAMFLTSFVPGVRSLFALYVNRQVSDLAMSTLIVAENELERVKVSYVEFVRSFDNGVLVQTNNSPEIGSFKCLPGEHTTQFWDIDDVHQLYRLHWYLADKHSKGAPNHLPAVDGVWRERVGIRFPSSPRRNLGQASGHGISDLDRDGLSPDHQGGLCHVLARALADQELATRAAKTCRLARPTRACSLCLSRSRPHSGRFLIGASRAGCQQRAAQ